MRPDLSQGWPLNLAVPLPGLVKIPNSLSLVRPPIEAGTDPTRLFGPRSKEVMRVSTVVVVHTISARCSPFSGSTGPLLQEHGSRRLSLQHVQFCPATY